MLESLCSAPNALSSFYKVFPENAYTVLKNTDKGHW